MTAKKMAITLLGLVLGIQGICAQNTIEPFDTTDQRAVERALQKLIVRPRDTRGDDPLDQRRYLPGEQRPNRSGVIDTVPVNRRYEPPRIALLTRTYGDSIVLRWMPADYASWTWLNHGGYHVVRMQHRPDTVIIDTLAHTMKPLTLEQMRARHATTDTVAMAAMGLMYGQNRTLPTQTHDQPGSLGSLVELWEEQQNIFGYAMLISEWRRDLAQDMALRFVDRNVRSGETYTYVVSDAAPDTTGNFLISPGYVYDLKNTRYQPKTFNVAFTDSLLAQNTIELRWTNMNFASYRIERRQLSPTQTPWQKATDKPYVPAYKVDGSQQQLPMLQQVLPGPGTYEYRIYGYDSFGDLVGPSNVHTVTMGDIEPPSMPELHSIVIDRPDNKDLEAKVIAHFNFGKKVKEPDFIGYGVFYYHDSLNDGQWMPLTQELIPPTDTTFTADVTALQTGWVVIVATDRSGNNSYSMPALLRVADLRPPLAPANIKAHTSIIEDDASKHGNSGIAQLTWDKGETDIAYYDVAMANDTTHQFQIITDGQLRDTIFVDTIATNLNQRYIYYKVRAVDHSTNVGPWSPVVQVLRPHATPPDMARLESAREDDEAITLNYIGSGEATAWCHLVYRHLEGDSRWTLIRCLDADSLQALGTSRFTITDSPTYEQQRRYEYCVETINTSGISSGASLVYAVYHRGPQVLDVGVKLVGDYDRKEQQTRLAWEVTNKDKLGNTPHYFAVYRKTDEDANFRFVTSVEGGDLSYSDVAVRPGHSAQYYVKLRLTDGREGQQSNIVTVKAEEPKK